MTDGEAFLLVFVLIYLSDCLVWLSPGAYALVSFWRPRFFVKRAAVRFDALRKGFAVLNPLPPFGSVFVSEAWPISLSEEGIAPFSRENPNPGSALGPLPGTGYLSWDSIERIEAREHALWINGQRYAWCATRHATTLLARNLESLRQTPAPERSMAIARLVRRRFCERNASRRATLFRRVTAPMRLSASLLFFGVFFLLPFAYWRFHDEPRFFLILLMVWVLMLQIAIEFARLHRRFYPKLATERWQHFLFAVLFPHYTIRSLDLLGKGFLAGSHPLAIAAALSQREELAKLARSLNRDARHPIPLIGENLQNRVAEIFHEVHFAPALEETLARLNHPESERSPSPTDEDESIAECPRCGTAYDRPEVPCTDCDGIETVLRFT
ncbi:MAG: hypothetical protein KDN20_06230 [Verrucomicrobiae bacterium]|nr:hypothetical protein [Verrucomicrobiae bacterium]